MPPWGGRGHGRSAPPALRLAVLVGFPTPMTRPYVHAGSRRARDLSAAVAEPGPLRHLGGVDGARIQTTQHVVGRAPRWPARRRSELRADVVLQRDRARGSPMRKTATSRRSHVGACPGCRYPALVETPLQERVDEAGGRYAGRVHLITVADQQHVGRAVEGARGAGDDHLRDQLRRRQRPGAQATAARRRSSRRPNIVRYRSAAPRPRPPTCAIRPPAVPSARAPTARLDLDLRSTANGRPDPARTSIRRGGVPRPPPARAASPSRGHHEAVDDPRDSTSAATQPVSVRTPRAGPGARRT